MVKVILDPHAHLTDAADIYFGNKRIYGLGINPLKIIPEVIRIGNERHITMNNGKNYSILGIIDFEDKRYEIFSREIEKYAEKWEMEPSFDSSRRVLSLEMIYAKLMFLAGEEIATDKGHVLLLGGDRKIQTESRKLEDVVIAGRDQGALVIADHPLAGPALQLMGLVPKKSEPDQKGRMGLNWIDITRLKRKGLIDYVELRNPLFKDYWADQEIMAEELGIPVITGSDSHTPGGVFKSYNEIENLDIPPRSREDLVGYILDNFGLIKNIKTDGSNDEFIERWRHALSVVGCHFGLKTGLFRRDSPQTI